MPAFVYHGGVERLRKEVAEAQDAVNARYREIFGDENFARLEEISGRVLTPDCFFDTVDQYRDSLGGTLPANASSKFLPAVMADPSLHSNGRIRDPRAKASVAFYVSEDSFKNSGTSQFTDRIIATYIHEFNHFAMFALQQPPLTLALNYMYMKQFPEGYKDIVSLAANLSLDSRTPREEKRRQMTLALSAHALNDVSERSNQILDNMVLESAGIQGRNLDWRGKERQYTIVEMHDPFMQMAVPYDGDPFAKIDDSEVVNRYINWQRYHRPIVPNVYMGNFFSSLGNLQVELMPLEQLKREHKKSADAEKKKNLQRRKRR